MHDNASSEENARLVAAGADVVLHAGISRKSMAEAIEKIMESRQQLAEKGAFPIKERSKPKLEDFVSRSDTMRIFMEEVRQVIDSSSPLLLLGETGVGKEHLARAIHAESPRSGGPFVTVNTAALPEQLLESELFGHTQGAFTGAVRSRRGAFEMAHRGTIFLDEIGEMPLHLQSKLLRALQDYEVKPLGGESPVWVDVRVIAATNRDLEEEVRQKNFRKDLYYRLSVIMLTIPPLRERMEDIPAMARNFLEYHRLRFGREISGISEPVMQALCRYEWPGNVRELMNVIERAMLLCRGHQISLEDLPHAFRGAETALAGASAGGFDITAWQNKTLPQVQQEVLEMVERSYLEMILRQAHGRVGKAAKMAGVHPRGLYNKMKRLGLSKEMFKDNRAPSALSQ